VCVVVLPTICCATLHFFFFVLPQPSGINDTFGTISRFFADYVALCHQASNLTALGISGNLLLNLVIRRIYGDCYNTTNAFSNLYYQVI
jgi:hypothetical protein